LVSLEERSQSADHRSVVLLELPPLGDQGETLALQRRIEQTFLVPNIASLSALVKTHLTLKGKNAKFHFKKQTTPQEVS